MNEHLEGGGGHRGSEYIEPTGRDQLELAQGSQDLAEGARRHSATVAKEMSPRKNLDDGDLEFSQGSKADKVADEMDYTPIRRSVFGRRADTMNYQYLQGYIK